MPEPFWSSADTVVVDEEEEPASASASLVVHRFLSGGTIRPIDGNDVEVEDLKAFPKNKLSFDAISPLPHKRKGFKNFSGLWSCLSHLSNNKEIEI